MSRYNNPSGGNDNDYEDDITLKLQNYAAIRMDGERVNAFNGNWGDRFIAGFENTAVIDGVVFQREDKPGTWKVFSADKFFHLNPEDGLIYQKHQDGEYITEMSAEDILEHARVQGFSESIADNDYFYEPVGVVVEAAGDVALNDDNIGDSDYDALTETAAETARSETEIPVGRTSMMLSNQSWVRTLAKKLTKRGDAIINDNGKDPTPRGEEEVNPKYADYEWLTTLDPELRDDLEGRELELWVTEETQEYDDGEQTYTQPNLLDVKTSTPDEMNFITIDNDVQADDGDDGDDGRTNHEAGQDAAEDHDEPAANPEREEPAEAAADGGTTTESAGSSENTETPSTDSPDAGNDASGDSGLPEDVPEVLDDLIDYFARTQEEAEPDELREFAADEVDNPDDVDWDAAAAEVEARA